jgi:sortase A
MFFSDITIAPDGGGYPVLSGHWDTVFYKLDELKNGDFLNVEYDENIYTYVINKIYITDPEDRTVIVKKDSPTLTLIPCYPLTL